MELVLLLEKLTEEELVKVLLEDMVGFVGWCARVVVLWE